MKITCNKTDLNFIGVFNAVASDKEDIRSAMTKIKVEDGKLYFSQSSSKIQMFKEMDCNFEGECNIYINTNLLYNLINTASDETEITIDTEAGIKIGNRANYQVKFEEMAEDYYFEAMLDYSKRTFNKKELKGIKKFNKLKKFVQEEMPTNSPLSFIAIFENSMATGTQNRYVFINQENSDVQTSLFIPKSTLNLFSYLGKDEMDFNVFDEESGRYYMLNFNEIYIFIPELKCLLPNPYSDTLRYMDAEKTKIAYEHDTKVIFDTNLIKKALNTLKYVIPSNMEGYITCEMNEGFVKFVNKVDSPAEEIVEAEVDPNLIGKRFTTRLPTLMESIELVGESKIVICISKNSDETGLITFEEGGAIRITNEDISVNSVCSIFNETIVVGN